MKTTGALRIHLAVRNSDIRAQIEDQLTLDGFEVSVFSTAAELWNAFRASPGRFIIIDRRIADGLSGLELVQHVREHFLLPYIYVLMLSSLNTVGEIKQGLAVGVDDYFVKPFNSLQLRSRVLVGIRWLNYIDALFADEQWRVAKAVRLNIEEAQAEVCARN